MRLVTGTAWLAAIVFFLLSYPAAAATIVSTCAGELSTPGETYELDQDVGPYNDTTDYYCFSITGDNVTLDCKGHVLTGILLGGELHNQAVTGVHVAGTNDTVTGCGFTNYSRGIKVSGDLATVKNNTFQNITMAGIWASDGGDNSTFFNNSLYLPEDFASASISKGIAIEGRKFMNVSFNYINFTPVFSFLSTERGIDLYLTNNSVISQNTVSQGGGDYFSGIGISYNGWNGTIFNNTVSNSGTAFWLTGGYLNASDNSASFSYTGFDSNWLGKSVLRNNVANNNTNLQFRIFPDDDYGMSDDDIDTSNTANGEPIYYFYNASNIVLSGLSLTAPNTSIGKIICFHCTNFTIENSVFSNNNDDEVSGLFLVDVNDSLIFNNTFQDNVVGVNFYSGGANCNISSNSFVSNVEGTFLGGVANTTLSENNFTSNTGQAIYLASYSPDWITSGTKLKDNYGSGNAAWLTFDGDTPGDWSVIKDGIQLTYYGVSSANPIESSIYLGTGVIAVNASANPDLNTSANVTLKFTGRCPQVNLYYYNGYSTDLTTIVSGGQPCNSTSTPACNILSCSGNTVTFSVEHFDSYGGLGYDIPEFSPIAALAAIALAGAGYALVGKRKRS